MFAGDEGEDRVIPVWYTRPLIRRQVTYDDAVSIKAFVGGLISTTVRWDETGELVRVERARRAAVDAIEEAVDTMRLRHIIDGRCKLCAA